MRIVAISDQHGFLPSVPPCDLLIVAGDICQDFVDGVPAIAEPASQKGWFDSRVRAWLRQSPATYKIATWGNHDFCAHYGRIPARLRCTFLVDQSIEIEGLLVHGTPWTTPFSRWAFS